jgi:hypothetical protein
MIDLLRAEEGDSVTILCDNPDFNGQPNCAVICNGDWTGWNDRRFAADTVLDALAMAMTEKRLPAPRKVIAESNGHHWVERFHLVCCRDCGIVRRADDQNNPCKGTVRVGPRVDAQAAPDHIEIKRLNGLLADAQRIITEYSYRARDVLRAELAQAETDPLKHPEYIIEGIILRRLHEKRIEGYTLEMCKEIAAALSLPSTARAILPGHDETMANLDALTIKSTDPRCTCAAIVNPNIPHARTCPLFSPQSGGQS